MVNHVVITSGGMDSFTLFHKVMREMKADDRIYALSFNYGQRHKKELDFARRFVQESQVPHIFIDLAFMQPMLRGSALTDNNVAVPHGHYEAESMKKTVVPGRNTIMLAIALGIGEGMEGYGAVYYGAHSGDHHIYPDCRPSYVATMQLAFTAATEGRIRLEAPYIDGNKVTILAEGFAMGLDYSKTWTCYAGEEKPCGLCGACQERAAAFAQYGVADPLLA